MDKPYGMTIPDRRNGRTERDEEAMRKAQRRAIVSLIALFFLILPWASIGLGIWVGKDPAGKSIFAAFLIMFIMGMLPFMFSLGYFIVKLAAFISERPALARRIERTRKPLKFVTIVILIIKIGLVLITFAGGRQKPKSKQPHRFADVMTSAVTA